MTENSGEDFFSLYLEYTAKTECPTFFHRWTAITSLAAYLGREIYFRHGHFTIHPNLYVMLIGSPGTKKSSAIKIGAKLLRQAGYTTFAARKTRQEKYLLDLSMQDVAGRIAAGEPGDEDDILESNLFGDGGEQDHDSRPPALSFIAADEFNNFIGLNNMDFMSILGELWDYEGTYDYRLKNSKSIYIPNPTVTILGGNTPTGFSQAFGLEAIGQGFFSRLLLVYGEPSGVKYTFPPPPDAKLQVALVQALKNIKTAMVGEILMTPDAADLLHKIYHTWDGIQDTRFEHYTNRRLTQLLKLCLVVVASRASKLIDVRDVVYANTILSFTEHLMPKALGEFGKAKNSDVAHRIMQLLDGSDKALTLLELWKHVHTDLDKRENLTQILGNLTGAGKIQAIEGAGYLPIKQVRAKGVAGATDWSIFTDVEMELL